MATNRVYEPGRHIPLFVPSGTISGDPVVSGLIAGVAVIDRQTDGRATVETGGTYSLTVKGIDGGGNSAVNEGDLIYYVAADTPKLSKKATGVLFGVALHQANAVAPANPVLASGATGTIHVKIHQV